MKKKLSEETKAKLIYSGELILIALVFLVIAILEFTRVIDKTEKNHAWFNWITIFGGSWALADFFWALFSKKRRKKICLLDKILTLPLAIYVISFDIYCFSNGIKSGEIYQICLPIAFSYVFIIYTFEGIYHWFKPIPGIFDDLTKEEKKDDTLEEVTNDDENKSE